MMTDQKFLTCKICGHIVPKKKNLGNVGNVCGACRKRYRQLKMKLKAIAYKGGKCEKCGYNKDINALDFHHIEPSEKEFTISAHFTKPWEKLKKEIDKCSLLCANCHREEHTKQSKHYTIEEYEKWIHHISEEESKKRISTRKIKQLEKEQKVAKQNEQNIKRKEAIKNSNIDFSKFGWSKQLEPILGIKSAAIVRWIKKHMPSFYQTQCYKEKAELNKKEINTIINQYISGETIYSISQNFDIDCARVSLILHKNNIKLKRQSQSKKVNMIDYNTNQVVKTFMSISEAANYCEENHTQFNINTIDIKTIMRKISKCVNGYQQTAYGYYWTSFKS